MISFVSRRFIHSSRMNFSTARSSSLGKLRKSTGYSVSNCKKALDMFPDDVVKAEEWLHSEAKQKGWSKWAKIQSRSATQGLVGTFSNNKIGVMLEVNCETDFVARNVEFHQLVEQIISSCVNEIPPSKVSEDVNKIVLDESQLCNLQTSKGTVGELVNSAISKFNEKTVAKRAIILKVADGISLSSLSHPSTSCPNLQRASIGRYGTLLAYKDSAGTCPDALPQNICQHIIGMSPTSVGQLTEQDIQNFSRSGVDPACDGPEDDQGCRAEKEAPREVAEGEQGAATPPGEGEAEDDAGPINADVKNPDETRLLFQTFLLDPDSTVGEVVHKNGLDIVDFERFECGQRQPDDKSEVEEAERATA